MHPSPLLTISNSCPQSRKYELSRVRELLSATVKSTRIASAFTSILISRDLISRANWNSVVVQLSSPNPIERQAILTLVESTSQPMPSIGT